MGAIPAGSIFEDETEKTVIIHGQVYKKTNTSNIQILYLKNNSEIDSKIMVYDETFTEVAIGQTIRLRGRTKTFERARNQGNFDQSLYYAKQDLYGVIWCEQVVAVTGDAHWLRENLYKVKTHWRNMILEVMGDTEGNILVAMLLGEKGEMDSDIKELYQKNGIGHILAISGLHISFIGLGIYKTTRRTGLGYILSGLISILFLSIYAIMIGFSVSVIRAYVMLLFRIGADMTGRVYDMLTALLVAAAFTVGIQPLYLTDAAFLLSYGAILGILFLLPCLESLFPSRVKFLSMWKASLAINVMLFPVLLWFYFEVPTYSILLNCLVIPLTSVLLGAGMLGSLFCWILWPVGNWCLQVCKWILWLIEMLSMAGSKLPLWRIVMGQPKLWQIVIYYLMLGSCILMLRHYVKHKKNRIACLVLCVCMSLGILLLAYRPTGTLTVTMLDVGQGDGIFMRGPEGHTYFIDGGSSDVEGLGKQRIETFLKSQGVGKLDYVFLSHGDTDHCIGIKEMLGRQEVGIEIRRLVLPSNWRKDEMLVELVHIAQKAEVSVVVMKAGESITEGGMRLQCIQPTSTDSHLVGNEGSMVLSAHFETFSMLFTGDVEAQGEEALINRLAGQEFTVLKVAHHGSKYSSSERFLKNIQAKFALISSGEGNSYGHPHGETLERLADVGCRVFTTTKNGAITIQTDGNSLTIDHFLY